jgi:hypothetical protein
LAAAAASPKIVASPKPQPETKIDYPASSAVVAAASSTSFTASGALVDNAAAPPADSKRSTSLPKSDVDSKTASAPATSSIELPAQTDLALFSLTPAKPVSSALKPAPSTLKRKKSPTPTKVHPKSSQVFQEVASKRASKRKRQKTNNLKKVASTIDAAVADPTELRRVFVGTGSLEPSAEAIKFMYDFAKVGRLGDLVSLLDGSV